MNDTIRIRGARENNLKNVDLTIPRDKLVVFTGKPGKHHPFVSGNGEIHIFKVIFSCAADADGIVHNILLIRDF